MYNHTLTQKSKKLFKSIINQNVDRRVIQNNKSSILANRSIITQVLIKTIGRPKQWFKRK